MEAKTNWKHGTFYRPCNDKAPDAVVIFDDDDADGDSIYLQYGDRLSPCRTVNRSHQEHWREVIRSWAIRAPLLDMRANKSIPLPF